MQGSFGSFRQLEHHIDDSVRLYLNQEPDDYPAHWHNAAELIMPVENVYTLVVDDAAYHIGPGELFMVPPGVVHEIFAPESGSRYLFMIDQKEFYAVEGLSEVQHVLYPCVYLSMESDRRLLEELGPYFRRAVKAYEGESALRGAEVRLWLRLVLVRMAEHGLEGGSDAMEPRSPLRHQTVTAMMDACAFISEHCAEKLSLEGMVAYSGYSKYHFARVFKIYAGMSFYDYYMRQRVVLCRRLLSDSALRVTEVALRAGFDSIATFNRVFKQYEGVTPSQYRKMRQNKRMEG